MLNNIHCQKTKRFQKIDISLLQNQIFVFLQRFLGRLCAAKFKKHEALCSSCSWEREKFRIIMQESVKGSRYFSVD